MDLLPSLFEGIRRCFEELFVRILPVQVQLVEAGFRDLVQEHIVSRL